MRIVILTCLLVLIIVGGFIANGGYWENWPLFDRLSGPMRFRQYVTDPVPKYITNLRGGYSGFPSGWIVTRFSFDSDPQTWSFLKKWIKVDCLSNVTDFVPELSSADVYQQAILPVAERCKHGEYLVLDSNVKQGAIVFP